MATKTRNPTSEVAVTGTWSGTSRYLLLDDHPDSGNPIADGTTCSAAGALVMGFSVFDVPAGSTSLSVQVIYYDFKNGSQTAAAGSLIRCNDTTNRNSGSTHNAGNGNANIALRTDSWATNPKSGANWTVDEINGTGTNALTALGLRVTDASPTGTFSSAIVQATYTPPVTGSMSQTEVADDATATGTVAWRGSMAATDALDAFVASGEVVWSERLGTLAYVEALDSVAILGDVFVSGAAAVTDTLDSLGFGGDVIVAGSFGLAGVSDTGLVAGDVIVSGGFARTDALDVAAFFGTAAQAGGDNAGVPHSMSLGARMGVRLG